LSAQVSAAPFHPFASPENAAMSDPIPPGPETAATLRSQLQGVVPLLRESRQIDPEVKEALAELIGELIQVMDPNAPAAEAAHLAECSTHLVQALHRKHHAGVLTAAKERLEAAATRAETEAPVATGLARRLIDTLANLGI
jgi:hypothetical protein